MDEVDAETETVAAVVGSPVVASTPVGGGCIADARRVELADGRVVFTKSGARLPAGLMEVEASGLRWLGAAGAIRVPEVLGLSPDPEVLVLEWIDIGTAGPTTSAQLGQGLARLHAAGAPGFGGERDGFIGTLPQRNTPLADEWGSFWHDRRIEPLVRGAVARGALDPLAHRLVDRLGGRIGDLAGPPEPPARVHGDLWSGNVMVDTQGRPCLVDPAAYGGHREVDLAMYSLMGNPTPELFAAYEDTHPLAGGWRDRLTLWQLEPLLTHANMFGGGYGDRALAVLQHFT